MRPGWQQLRELLELLAGLERHDDLGPHARQPPAGRQLGPARQRLLVSGMGPAPRCLQPRVEKEKGWVLQRVLDLVYQASHPNDTS